jgi:hypothetical protein
VNSPLFSSKRADCHAEANAIAESAKFGYIYVYINNFIILI